MNDKIKILNRLTENAEICRSRAFRFIKFGVQRVPSLHAMAGDIALQNTGVNALLLILGQPVNTTS